MIMPVEYANEKQCWEAIDFFLSHNCIGVVIKYTNRLKEISEFKSKFLRP